jgi:uncharacterized protein YeaO (DUF488 family)
MMLNVRPERVYERSDSSDGLRVLIDHIWPRGVSRARRTDEWARGWPSGHLRTWFDHRPERFEELFKAGVDAVLVGDRIRALKPSTRTSKRRSQNSTTTAASEPGSISTTPAPSSTGYPTSARPSPPPTPSSAVRSTTPSASPSEIDRNEAQIRLKALVSSAFMGATDLEALVAHKAIAGERYALTGDRAVPVDWAAGWP